MKIEKETDGRWLAEVPSLPGAIAYGITKEEAVTKAKNLALCVLVDKIEHSDEIGPRMLARIARHTGLRPEDL